MTLKIVRVRTLVHEWFVEPEPELATRLWRPGDRVTVIRKRATLELNPVSGASEALVRDYEPGVDYLLVLGSPGSEAPVNWGAAREQYGWYMASSGGVNYQGHPMLAWDELPQAIKDHWLFVASMNALVRKEQA